MESEQIQFAFSSSSGLIIFQLFTDAKINNKKNNYLFTFADNKLSAVTFVSQEILFKLFL